MAIIEAVLFNNEFELLEARFHEGDGIVDEWIVIEADETFTGKPKPLHFDEAANAGRYDQFIDKVLHLTVEFTGTAADPWEREALQRDVLAAVLRIYEDDDLIVLSDGDELTRSDIWEFLLWATAGGDSVALHKPTWYYTLTWALQDSPGGSNASYRSKAARVSTVRSYDRISDWADERYFASVENTGWHLSCLGGPARLYEELQASSHQELNVEGWVTYENCKKMISEGMDCSFLRNAALTKTDPAGPAWLLDEGARKYPWLLTGDDPCTQLS